MSKAYIIHENDEWMEPLRYHLNNLSVPFEEWHMNRVNINTFNQPPTGVFYNRMSASSHSRGHKYAPEYTAVVLNWLELHNKRIINNSRALALEISKSLQYQELKKEGIRIPQTLYASGKDSILNLGKKIQPPFLTKHNRAGRGLGINLFNSYSSLKKYVNSDDFEDSIDGITLLQEYIKPIKSTIIRTEFIENKFLYAVQIDASKGFQLCPADDCSFEDEYCPANTTGNKFMILDKFFDPILDKFQKVLRKNHIEIAGIEFVKDKNGKIFTYDINTNTNYNSIAEKHSDKKGMQVVAKFLKKELRKIN